MPAPSNIQDNSPGSPLPLPKYFATLYSEYPSLNKYPLKDVIYDRKIQE